MTGQLHLFKPRRQRGVKAPPAPEFRLQCMIADDLRRWATPGWIYSHFPAGERRDEVTGARLKRMGLMPGWPDFILLRPHRINYPALAHFLELKRRGGKLSEHQAAFKLWCMLNGCPHAMVDNYRDAVAILKQWGALRASVKVQ